jgi:hypothetical protein
LEIEICIPQALGLMTRSGAPWVLASGVVVGCTRLSTILFSEDLVEWVVTIPVHRPERDMILPDRVSHRWAVIEERSVEDRAEALVALEVGSEATLSELPAKQGK